MISPEGFANLLEAFFWQGSPAENAEETAVEFPDVLNSLNDLIIADERFKNAVRKDITFPDNPESDLAISLMQVVVENPITAKSLIDLLIREGRDYAETEEGSKLKASLKGSQEVLNLHKLLTVLLAGLDEQTSSNLPSAYMERLLYLSSNANFDDVLKQYSK